MGAKIEQGLPDYSSYVKEWSSGYSGDGETDPLGIWGPTHTSAKIALALSAMHFWLHNILLELKGTVTLIKN